MKKLSEFAIGLFPATRYILYIGMLSAIMLLTAGTIIYHNGANFNTYHSYFTLAEQLISCGNAFIACTLITSALSEYCLRQCNKKDS